MLTSPAHPWHDGGNPDHYESRYASLLYMCFRTTQVEVLAEQATSHERANMVFRHEGQFFVLEFKMVKDITQVEESLDGAIRQIRQKRHAEKYHGKPVHLIDMVFGGQGGTYWTSVLKHFDDSIEHAPPTTVWVNPGIVNSGSPHPTAGRHSVCPGKCPGLPMAPGADRMWTVIVKPTST